MNLDEAFNRNIQKIKNGFFLKENPVNRFISLIASSQIRRLENEKEKPQH
jgi:hypothetical protein